MKDSNKQTIQSYEGNVQKYIDGTPQDVVSAGIKEWIDAALSGLTKDVKILEFGSGFGRDATYIQGKGYSVQCTDATQAFVDFLREKGFNAQQLNVITDQINGSYDLIFASAVLLHFTRDETKLVLQKVYDALSSKGTFAFTLKQGEGETWVTDKLGAPRFFCFWTETPIRELLEKAGFVDIKIRGNKVITNTTWLQIIAKKN